MRTNKIFIVEKGGAEIIESKALIWGNNASWLCTVCNELLGNRTGDSDYRVTCVGCGTLFEILRESKNDSKHLTRALGVMKL